jgi:hypothetical protein
MKTTRLPNSFLLISFRKILQDFLAFFRFTEADAIALASAYGRYALEADRLQDNRPIVQKKTSGSLEETNHRQRIGEPSGPIAIGVHPDFTRGNWTTAWQNQVCRPLHVREPISAPPSPKLERDLGSWPEAPARTRPGGTHDCSPAIYRRGPGPHGRDARPNTAARSVPKISFFKRFHAPKPRIRL